MQIRYLYNLDHTKIVSNFLLQWLPTKCEQIKKMRERERERGGLLLSATCNNSFCNLSVAYILWFWRKCYSSKKIPTSIRCPWSMLGPKKGTNKVEWINFVMLWQDQISATPWLPSKTSKTSDNSELSNQDNYKHFIQSSYLYHGREFNEQKYKNPSDKWGIEKDKCQGR